MSALRSRRWMRVLAALATAGVASLGMAEIAVRWLLPQPRGFSWLTEEGLQLHIPNRDAVYARAEFEARVRFNSHGFRGPEPSAQKAPGVLRVLALGDSFVEGLQVDESDLMTTRIEAALSASGRPAEVLNLGLSGHGTDDALDVLRVFGPRFEPDLVLLFFCVANDFQNNAFEGRCQREGHGTRCAQLVRPSRGRLAFAHSKSRLSTYSALYQALQAAVTDPFWQRIGLRVAPAPTQATDPSFLLDLFAEVPPPAAADAISITTDLLASLRDEASALGARFWLVVLPIREQVEDDAWARFSGEDRALRRDAPQRALSLAATQLGIPIVDPLDAFRARDAAGERLFWRVDAHFNSVGHEVTAAAVTAALTADTETVAQ